MIGAMIVYLAAGLIVAGMATLFKHAFDNEVAWWFIMIVPIWPVYLMLYAVALVFDWDLPTWAI